MFVTRAIIYFLIWLIFSYFLNKWSKEEDRGGDRTRRLAALSAPGLIVYVFTMTFASIDWAESLIDHWYSTIWGFIFVVGQGLSAMAFVIVVVALLSRRRPLSEAVKPGHFHDLGKLLFMFVMLWGYMEFSQLLIVWSGNLTGEIPWYLPTFATTWGWVGAALIAFQFLVPFLLLLSRKIKRNPKALCGVVSIIIFMRFVDLFWIVMPGFHMSGFSLNWLNVSVPLALGGLWIAAFLWQLGRGPLLPLRAPNLEDALHHGRD
jgi:MFS family permease